MMLRSSLLGGSPSMSSSLSPVQILPLLLLFSISSSLFSMIPTVQAATLPLNDTTIRQAVQRYFQNDNVEALYQTYGDITEWQTDEVTDMENLFANANTFNVDLSSWKVARVTNMRGLFQGASHYDQSLCWDNFHPSVDVSNMFCGTNGARLDPCCTQDTTVLRDSCCGACNQFCLHGTNTDLFPSSTPTETAPTNDGTNGSYVFQIVQPPLATANRDTAGVTDGTATSGPWYHSSVFLACLGFLVGALLIVTSMVAYKKYLNNKQQKELMAGTNNSKLAVGSLPLPMVDIYIQPTEDASSGAEDIEMNLSRDDENNNNMTMTPPTEESIDEMPNDDIDNQEQKDSNIGNDPSPTQQPSSMDELSVERNENDISLYHL